METYNPIFARSDQLNRPWHYGSTIDCILKMEVATDFWFHILDYRHSLPKNESQTSGTVSWSSRERGRHAVSVKNYEKCHCKHTLCFSDFTVIPSYRSVLYSVSSVLFFSVIWLVHWEAKKLVIYPIHVFWHQPRLVPEHNNQMISDEWYLATIREEELLLRGKYLCLHLFFVVLFVLFVF